MKKLLIVFIALTFVSMQSQAQNEIVKMKSDIGQGYLVMHQLQNVDYWKVNIVKRAFNAQGQYTDKTIEKHNLPSGQNYVKIHSDFRHNKENGDVHFAEIEGFSKTNAKVVKHEEPITRNFSKDDLEMYIPRGPIGGSAGAIDGCSWTCDGKYYAWTIQERLIGSGNGVYGPASYLALETAYQYFDEEAQVAIPYYRYMDYPYWQNNCWSLGFSCEAPEYQNLNVIGVFDGDENDFYYPNGNLISGGVVGVRKDRGPWQNYSIQTENIFNNPCGASGSQAIDWINDEIENMDNEDIPILQCNSLTPINYVLELENEETPFGSCFDEIEIEIQDYDSLWTMFQTFYDCLAESSNSPFNTVLESLTILDINDDSNGPIAVDISKALALDPNTTTEKVVIKTFKQFVAQSNDPSLLCIGVEMKKGVYAPFIVNVSGIGQGMTNNPNSRLAAVAETDVSIAPNPSYGGTQTLTLNSKISGVCAYELSTISGQLLESQSHGLEKGIPLELILNTNKYPPGVLIHKFSFSDGTQKTIRSVHFN